MSIDKNTTALESDTLEDSNVLSRLMEGRADELANLFSRIRDSLKSMICTRLDPRLHARIDASDIVQDTYIRASQGLDRYLSSPSVHPVVWLRLIGKHLVTETHRRHFRVKRSPQQEVTPSDSGSQFLIAQLSDSMPSVLSKLTQEELSCRINGVIETMDEHDREIIDMRHTDEMSIVEIAETLSISVDAAKKRYYRALGRFRERAAELLDNSSN